MSLDAKIQSIFNRAARDLVAAIRSTLADEVRALQRSGPGRGARGDGGRGRRSSAQIAATVDKLLDFIKKNPGLRTEQIQEKLGGDAGAVKDALARLRASGKVKTKGVKRAMTYRV